MASKRDYNAVDIPGPPKAKSLDSRTFSLFKLLLVAATATAAVGGVAYGTVSVFSAGKAGPTGPAGPAGLDSLSTVVVGELNTTTVLGALAAAANTSANIAALQTRMASTETMVVGSSPLVTAVLKAGSNITQLAATSAAQSATLAGIATTDAAQATSITALNTLTTTQATSITALNTLTATQATSITALNSGVATQGSSITALNSSITALSTLTTTLSAADAAQSAAMAGLVATDVYQNATLAGLTSGAAATSATVATQGSTIIALSSTVAANSVGLTTQAGAITSVNATVAVNSAAIATHTTQISSLNTSVIAHASTLATHTTQISALQAAPGPTSAVLTGFVAGSGTVQATDTVLGAIEKLAGGSAGSTSTTVPTFNVTGTLTANTATFTTFVPQYMPIQSNFTGTTIEFYGDSIVHGDVLTLSSARWPTVLSTLLGATEYNQGQANTEIPAVALQLFNQHVSGRTTFIGAGFNDVRYRPLNAYDELMNNYDAIVLWASLPVSIGVSSPAGKKLHDAANTNVFSFTGTWVTEVSLGSSYQRGMSSTATGATITGTVNGRYIVFAYFVLGGDTVSHGNYAVTIDGNAAIQGLTSIGMYTYDTGSPTPITQLFFYDAGSVGSHTITVTVLAVSGSSPSGNTNFWIHWMGAFDGDYRSTNLDNPNPVFMCGPSPLRVGPDGNSATQQAYETLRLLIKRRATYWRKRYGLRTYFVDMDYPSTYGMSIEGIHPNVAGHNTMASIAYDTMMHGEFNAMT